MPASVVVIGFCCSFWSLIYFSNCDLFLTIDVVVRRNGCTLHIHTLPTEILLTPSFKENAFSTGLSLDGRQKSPSPHPPLVCWSERPPPPLTSRAAERPIPTPARLRLAAAPGRAAARGTATPPPSSV